MNKRNNKYVWTLTVLLIAAFFSAAFTPMEKVQETEIEAQDPVDDWTCSLVGSMFICYPNGNASEKQMYYLTPGATTSWGETDSSYKGPYSWTFWFWLTQGNWYYSADRADGVHQQARSMDPNPSYSNDVAPEPTYNGTTEPCPWLFVEAGSWIQVYEKTAYGWDYYNSYYAYSITSWEIQDGAYWEFSYSSSLNEVDVIKRQYRNGPILGSHYNEEVLEDLPWQYDESVTTGYSTGYSTYTGGSGGATPITSGDEWENLQNMIIGTGSGH